MEIKNIALEWLRYAETDLNVAIHLQESYYPMPVEIICFHCQQSVEKALKAILSHNDAEIRKIHDINEIQEMTKIFEPNIVIDEKIAVIISSFAVASRYPESCIDLTEADAVLGLKYAKSTLEQVKRALGD